MFYLATGWIIYFFLHSVLASLGVKHWVEKHFPFIYRYYRLLYNIIAFTGLALLLYLQRSISSAYVFSSSVVLKVSGWVLILTGLFIIAASFRNYNLHEFIGLKTEKPSQKLITNGLNSVVRHPIYLGTIVLMTGYFLSQSAWKNLMLLALVFLYLFIGAAIEERKLIRQFGAQYIEYRKRVPMLIPFLL